MKFLSRNPIRFSFQSWNKSRFTSRKNNRIIYGKNWKISGISIKNGFIKLILKDFERVNLYLKGED